MAIDCPDEFVPIVKTRPCYPPPPPLSLVQTKAMDESRQKSRHNDTGFNTSESMLLQKSGESSLSLLEPLSGSIRFIDEDSRVALSISEVKTSHVNDGFVLEEEEVHVLTETHHHTHSLSSSSPPTPHYQQHKLSATTTNNSKIKGALINFRPPTPPPRSDKSLSCYKENFDDLIAQTDSSNANKPITEPREVHLTVQTKQNEPLGVDNKSFESEENAQSFKTFGNDLKDLFLYFDFKI